MIKHIASALFALLLPLAASAAAPPAPVEGTDYVVIPDGQPWQPRDGKIEVVEIFAYPCHHCAALEPLLEAWRRKLPGDVRFSALPAAYDPGDRYARAFFAANRMGVLAQTHAALFRAIHDEHSVPMGNASTEELAAFYRQHGVDAGKLAAAMSGAAVAADMQRARAFVIASGLLGTPTLVVDGRYRVQGRSHEDTLRIAGQLVAMQRAARKRR